MALEEILTWTRVIILVGVVLFAFSAMIFGLYIIFREYRLVSNFDQLEKFIALTNSENTQADVLKGTIALGRSRPGMILVFIGAVLLIFILLKPFSYTTEETSSRTENKKKGDASAAQQLDHQIKDSTTQNSGGEKDKSSPVAAKQPDERKQAGSIERHQVAASKPKLTIESLTLPLSAEDYFKARTNLLDQWLSLTGKLEGKDMQDQAEFLEKQCGKAFIGVESTLRTEPVTFEELAENLYGDQRFAALLKVFNSKISKDEDIIPAYTRIIYLNPLSSTEYSVTESRSKKVTIQIAGASKLQVYEHILDQVDRLEQSGRYSHITPADFWKSLNKDPAQFVEAYSAEFHRQAQLRPYTSVSKDTPDVISRIAYGDNKFIPLLIFFNPELAGQLQNADAALPVGTTLRIFKLIEY